MLDVGIVRLPKLQTSEQLLNVGEMRKACLELLGTASILQIASIHRYGAYVHFHNYYSSDSGYLPAFQLCVKQVSSVMNNVRIRHKGYEKNLMISCAAKYREV
jgi:hypothetical protein